jgi:GT2 family glycosyltransferase
VNAIISVVIPTYSRFDLLVDSIDALLSQTVKGVEIIVVDNTSPKGIKDQVMHRYGSRVQIIRLDRNYFFCGAVNRGSELVHGRYLAVLNDDCRPALDWAERVIETFAEYPEAGSVATLVLRASEPHLIDSAGDHLDVSGRASNRHWNDHFAFISLSTGPVFSAAGSCAVYRRDLFLEAGRFDEDFVAYLDDIDLGFRLSCWDILPYLTRRVGRSMWEAEPGRNDDTPPV